MKKPFAIAVSTILLGACSTTLPRTRETIPSVAGERLSKGGLEYIDIARGSGAPIASGKCAYTHYTGWLTNGVRVDSSRDGEPVAFIQGSGKVLRGWEIGIEGMRAGAKRRLLIPYQLAYGTEGSPPLVPSRADMIFDVELMAVTDATNHQCRPWKEVSRSG